MIRTVDLVVVGDDGGARAAAADALERGRRVLVVLGSYDPGVGRRLRRYLRNTAGADGGQLTVMTRAEVVCADGVDGVEAVVIRHARTGRLSAVNAPALYRSTPRRSRDGRSAATENESRSVQERGSEPRPSYSLVRGYVRRWN